MGEVPSVEILLFVLVDGVAGDPVHNHPERVVPVAAVTLQSHMDVVHADHDIVHNPNEILLCECFFLTAVVPFLLHFHFDAFHHASQQFCGVHCFVDFLVADVEEHIDALYLDYGVFFLEGGPGDVDVYLFDVAELEREGEAELVHEGWF